MKQTLALLPLIVLAACGGNRVIDGDALADGTYQNADGQTITAQDGVYYDQYGALISVNPSELTSIQGESDRIVLSDYSQEQQVIDRRNYAAQLDQIEAGRIDINDAPTAQVDTSVNVVAYARTTNNQLGVQNYQRAGNRGNCRSYGSADAAQRDFLINGGPNADPLGLDPDGDGFACDFDPSFYRSLRYKEAR